MIIQWNQQRTIVGFALVMMWSGGAAAPLPEIGIPELASLTRVAPPVAGLTRIAPPVASIERIF